MLTDFQYSFTFRVTIEFEFLVIVINEDTIYQTTLGLPFELEVVGTF